MKYICLLYENEKNWIDADPAQQQAIFAAHMDFTEAAKAAGKLVGGEALHPSTTATVVTRRGEETLTTDGPFLETKEQLGGYYVLDCEDLDEATEWAARIPEAKTGHVEVRPLMSFD